MLPLPPTLLYERTHFVESGDYAEAVAFCETLAQRSPYARVVRYGRTPEGRPMIALIVSAHRAFSPEAMEMGGRPRILVQNGIHAGEIEGKDASLILARAMLLEGKHGTLFQGADWIVLPVYNVDGHERRSPYNRINQNGPAVMGWRATAQNFNLNRDFMKADAPETRAWLGLVHRYRPDFLFDDHTTDGADYRYAAMLSVPCGPTLPSAVADFARTLYEETKESNDGKGFLTAPYFEVDREFVGRGLSVEDFSPRYTHGYIAAMGRPAMLVETHMLKPYRTRVETTYATIVATAEKLVERKAALRSFARAADLPYREGETVVLSSKPSGRLRPFTFLGWRYAPKPSLAAGTEVAAWIHEPVDTPTTIADAYLPGASVAAPGGYAVPAAWTEIVDRLRLHGVPMRAISKSWTERFETYRFSDVRFPSRPFEGRFGPSYASTTFRETRTLPPGTVVVPATRLAMQLLEPDAPDSLLRWGLFNAVFERKEYFEDYAMAPIGDGMLAHDPKLKSDFDAWLETNPAASKDARLAWLFDRSPYADLRLNAYPVVRLSGPQCRRL